MNNSLLKFALLGLSALEVEAAIPGRTLEDCWAFADLFDNTCTDDADGDGYRDKLDSITDHAGASLSCTGTDVRCPGTDGAADYDDSNPCTFTRKLCVTCNEQQSGQVVIRVQSNSLPNHCLNSTVNNAESIETEWRVNFNTDVTGI